MMKNKKKIALFMSCIVCITVLFSCAFISENVHHNCLEEKCQICEELEIAIQIISNIKGLNFVPLLMAILCVFAQVCMVDEGIQVAKDTLITLKVELLD